MTIASFSLPWKPSTVEISSALASLSGRSSLSRATCATQAHTRGCNLSNQVQRVSGTAHSCSSYSGEPRCVNAGMHKHICLAAWACTSRGMMTDMRADALQKLTPQTHLRAVGCDDANVCRGQASSQQALHVGHGSLRLTLVAPGHRTAATLLTSCPAAAQLWLAPQEWPWLEASALLR